MKTYEYNGETYEYNDEQEFIPFFGKPNLNNRIYTEEEIDKIVKQFNKKAKELPVFGQIEFPENCEMSLSKVSHRIHKIKKEKGKVIGTITILNTDQGKLLLHMLKYGVFRPRMSGTIDNNGIVTVDKIFSFDFILKENDSYNEEKLILKEQQTKTE